MSRELITVIEQIGREKGIDSGQIISAVESALVSAAKKRYGLAENIHVTIDRTTGNIEVISLKTIVDQVVNPRSEILLDEAKKVDSEAEMGDEIGSLIEIGDFGRIAAQTAKQIIFQKVREAEWEIIQRDYSARQGGLVNGIILGQDRRNYVVDLGKTEAILPLSEQIPRETYRRGDRIKAYLYQVKRTPKDVQVILSRAHTNFVAKLFALEVPEVSEKIVEIKGLVREAGDRTKIAVISHDRAVDPVGACVGVKGSRVQAIVRELRGEKIDIITWTSDPRIFIAEALNPTSIEKVGIDEEKKSALVVVSDQQLSLAIGKNGQNVRLAAKLTGWKIDIIGLSEYEQEKLEREQTLSGAAVAEGTISDADAPDGVTATSDVEYHSDAVDAAGEALVTTPPSHESTESPGITDSDQTTGT
ncbi:MAG TPA: transcription termination/antitermination protein NusA [Nitrospirales bacterium]|nr:transcription termination/antitermination protein NusA [Nitrospirales bacterium]